MFLVNGKKANLLQYNRSEGNDIYDDEDIKTTQQFKGVAIKINEAWCYTPEGSVDIFDFADFLRKETEQLDNLIAVYKKEFAEL
jgi:hypothetical protein